MISCGSPNAFFFLNVYINNLSILFIVFRHIYCDLALKKIMDVKQIVLAARPKGMPTKDQFRTETTTLRNLMEGDVLVKALYFSVDPYMRGRMNDAKSYAPPFKIDEPIIGGAIGEIVETKSGNFQKGDVVQGFLPWST